MQITVHNKVEKQVKNFWNAIHFHPTDAIEDAWGQRILNRVAEDKVAKTVRMYTMMEDIVSVDADGNLQYDFTENDVRMDYMVQKGFDLLLSYNFIPPCISSDPDEVSKVCKKATRYKGKFIVTAPPKDYKLWEEICYNYTKHIVERYGFERVKQWKLQCFNEPDSRSFFMRSEENRAIKAKEYCKLYDAFEAGIRRVSDDLFIGGPALAFFCDFLDVFLTHVRETKKKMDYICFHVYGTGPDALNAGGEITVENCMRLLRDTMAHIRAQGFGHLPVYIDEWGASNAGFHNREECPKLIFRENEVYSAFFVKWYTAILREGYPIEKMMICLSGQHEMEADFTGFRNFFTLNFFQKPIYNAYMLSAKLGEEVLLLKEEDGVTVFATKDAKENVQILLCNADETFSAQASEKTVTLKLEGFEEAYQVKKYIIDKTHSNAIDLYERIVENEQPTEAQIDQIREADKLYCADLGKCSVTEITETLGANAVVLYELIK